MDKNAVKSRRQEYAEATRSAIVAAARGHFARQGYEQASLNSIVEEARVSKGALYHHFKGKLELFLAVFEAMEQEVVQAVARAAAGAGRCHWKQVDAALWAFLDQSAEPDYLQIALHDAPHLVGMKQQREIDLRGGAAVIEAMMQTMIDAGELRALPAHTLARLWLGTLTEGAQVIAQAADRNQAKREVHDVIWQLLQGLKPCC